MNALERLKAKIAAKREAESVAALHAPAQAMNGNQEVFDSPDNDYDSNSQLPNPAIEILPTATKELSPAAVTDLRASLKAKLAEQNQASYTPNKPYNAQQQQAIDWALSGHSFAITGPAGSGKTYTVQGVIEALIQSGRTNIIQTMKHKYLPATGVPGIVVVAFTNTAVGNSKKALPSDLRGNALTIHKYLEYEPVYGDVRGDDGKMKSTMRFEPQRNTDNPQSSEITTVIIEEASMVPVDLWNRLIESMPARTHSKLQIIMVGDIQQLPPVFGKSIYIHAMASGIKTVELTHVYRQALESPILALAHRILAGKQMAHAELMEYSVDKRDTGKGMVFIRPWKNAISSDVAIVNMMSFLPKMIDDGLYDPDQDVILTPYNVEFGQEEMNKIVASHYSKVHQSPVYEVFTGINKKYFRVGERVLYNKSEAVILSIEPNKAYYGKWPRPASSTMDYRGIEKDKSKLKTVLAEMTDEEVRAANDRVDEMLMAIGSHTDEDSPTARAASHKIVVKSKDTDAEYTLSAAGEINTLELAYAMTVHKSQGREYRRVWFITHKSQATMIYRELLYTAVTRAKEELYVICEPNCFVKGINTQKYPGKTVMEKIESFNRAEKVGRIVNPDYIPKQLFRFINNTTVDEQVNA